MSKLFTVWGTAFSVITALLIFDELRVHDRSTDGWRSTSSAAPPSDQLVQGLDEVIQHLDERRTGDAARSLAGWLADLDLDSVPTESHYALFAEADDARSALLQQPPATDRAKAVLTEIRKLLL